jgi:hypothetical protein
MPPHSALPAALLVPDSPSQVLGGDTDELDGPVFDPIEFINKKFADERSLEGLDKAIAAVAERGEYADDNRDLIRAWLAQGGFAMSAARLADLAMEHGLYEPLLRGKTTPIAKGKAMGKAGAIRAHKLFSIEQMVAAHVDLYRSIDLSRSNVK